MPNPNPNDDNKTGEQAGDELELEPVDPEILENQRRRVKSRARELEDRVDIEELFESAEQTDPITLNEFKQFQFNTRHMLAVTALLAVAIAAGSRLGACAGMFAAVLLLLAAGWWLVTQKERAQRVQRRREMEQRGAAYRAATDGNLSEAPQSLIAPKPRPALSFAFSLKQLLGTFAIAAVALVLTHSLGKAENAALLLGFVALAGLLVHALGFDPPPVVILGWWLTLVLYILTEILAAFIA